MPTEAGRGVAIIDNLLAIAANVALAQMRDRSPSDTSVLELILNIELPIDL